MPYNPNYPQNGDLIDGTLLRNNINALNAKVDGIPAGPPGPQGPPFADAIVDGVSTLSPSDPATVSVSFDGTNVHFSFGIPKGADGDVTGQQLTDAIATTANNPTGYPAWGGSFSDPPTQTEMNDFAAWADGLRAALVR